MRNFFKAFVPVPPKLTWPAFQHNAVVRTHQFWSVMRMYAVGSALCGLVYWWQPIGTMQPDVVNVLLVSVTIFYVSLLSEIFNPFETNLVMTRAIGEGDAEDR